MESRLSVEEINDILDGFDYLLSRKDIVGIDLKEDGAGTYYFEIDQLEVSDVDKSSSSGEIPLTVDIPITSDKEGLRLVTLPVVLNKVSENVDLELNDEESDLLEPSEMPVQWFSRTSTTKATKIRPLPGGHFIKAANMKGIGTLGVSIIYRGTYKILSNNHVISKNGNANSWVYQPTDIVNKNRLAKVSGFIPIKYYKTDKVPSPKQNIQDIAWCNSDPTVSSQSIRVIGNVTGRRSAKNGENVLLYGAKTNRLVKSQVRSITKRYKSRSKVMGYSWWKNGIELKGPGTIAQAGDSGTAIIALSDKKLLGLVRSGRKSGNTYILSGCPL